ncbi:hypothetical protein U6A24_06735 [Aquimarina gracilis]|uniref:Basic secretory peptidase family protein n=1 Tax=Aquimarina gracilis TaxID=874422 RepID=A0ABU5ZSU1_9FLAO|nr:hypothetical protein [Aquimarina gracilis]MEB3345146.1 hypothetical protein [Aquimarina gracilis]
MKLSKLFFVVYILITGLSCKSQTSISRIEIVQPTIEREATSIWRTINDFTFFEKQDYNINLLKNSLIDSLITKSKNGTFGNEDFSSIYSLLEAKVFEKQDYELAIQKVEDNIDLVNNLVDLIDSKKNQWDWNFKMFDKYRVVLTLYGTGGSYDPEEGIITLLTNKEGRFMNYTNPANTIIHEITHMGMEYSIVQKYSLPHGLKERIVDTFVYLMFQKKLPEYKIQNMGDNKIDTYLNKQDDISSLNVIVSKFIN